MTILHLINGPNLALLGFRDPELYGTTTLKEIESELGAMCKKQSVQLKSFQSDSEGEIIAHIGTLVKMQTRPFGVIVNPGGLSHTSVALRDALEILKDQGVYLLEVHLSNIHAREEFRRHSFVSSLAAGVICGLGSSGYSFACQWLLEKSKKIQTSKLAKKTQQPKNPKGIGKPKPKGLSENPQSRSPKPK